MKDCKILWDNSTGVGDIGISNSDLQIEEGLETAVFMSLYTDQRAAEDENTNFPLDKRGWWGDMLESNGDQVGSKLWLYEREKLTTKVIAQIKDAMYDCLQWMIDDGIVARIDIALEKQENNKLFTEIKLFRQDDSRTTVKFDDLWNAQGGQ
jgi:phage gp46-like protein